MRWLRDAALPDTFWASRRSDYEPIKRAMLPWLLGVELSLPRGSWDSRHRFATWAERRFCSEYDAFR